LARALLLLAALDSLAAGAWAAARPAGLFDWLGAAPSPDALGLWRVLGVLLLGQALCLAAAAWRPADCGGLVLVPLAGRLLLCGAWLVLLGTDRVSLPPLPLRWLALHDALWVPVFLGFLRARRRAEARKGTPAMLWTALALLFSPSDPLPARPPEPAGQWIVVTAPAFRAALEPLCVHRRAEGLRVVVLQTTDVLPEEQILRGEAGKLRDRVHKLCRDWAGPSSVLLVGAIEAGRLGDAGRKVLPPGRGTAGRMKDQPTDNAYGCPGGGRLPAVAVGRFPARSETEARDMVAKTLRYEDARPAPWRRRLTVLAGIPAYNPLVDRVVESLALARFDRLDPAWTGRALYTNPQSRFCVPDARLHARALDSVQEGQAFTLYLGHSSARGLYGGAAPFLDREDWSRLRIDGGPGVFVTFGCNGCQLAGPDGEGYGVAAVRNSHGPAAVLGSHGICFAAMVQLAADGLFQCAFTGPPPERLGAAWLATVKGVAQGKIDDLTFAMLDAVDGDSRIPQPAQRQEHLEMFLLLGDPALRLPAVPADLRVEAPAPVRPGEALAVRGRLPARLAGARVRLTVERTAGSVPADLEPLPKAGDPARDRVMLANAEKANTFVLAACDARVDGERFEGRLPLPARLPWPRLLLRAYAATDTQEALNVLPLAVEKKKETEK
jgi:hypothetical protein